VRLRRDGDIRGSNRSGRSGLVKLLLQQFDLSLGLLLFLEHADDLVVGPREKKNKDISRPLLRRSDRWQQYSLLNLDVLLIKRRNKT
jgi:hypothetical protein